MKGWTFIFAISSQTERRSTVSAWLVLRSHFIISCHRAECISSSSCPKAHPAPTSWSSIESACIHGIPRGTPLPSFQLSPPQMVATRTVKSRMKSEALSNHNLIGLCSRAWQLRIMLECKIRLPHNAMYIRQLRQPIQDSLLMMLWDPKANNVS